MTFPTTLGSAAYLQGDSARLTVPRVRFILLLVSSMYRPDPAPPSLLTRFRALVGIYVVVNIAALLFWGVVGFVTLAGSQDGRIPGYAGAAVDQVVWFAVGSALFTTGAFGLPLLLVAAGLAWVRHRTRQTR